MIVFDAVRLEREGALDIGLRALLVGNGLSGRVGAALREVESVSALSLLEGVWQAGTERFDLILVGLDALGRTAAALRGLRDTAPDARIVVVCDPHEEPAAMQLVDAGADDYAVAPLTGDELRTVRRPRSPEPPASHSPPPPPEAQTELTNQVLARIGHGPETLLGALASLLTCVFQATAVTIEIDDLRFVGAADDELVIEQPIVGAGGARGRIRLGRAFAGSYSADLLARLESYAALVATAIDQDRSLRGWVDLALTDELTGLLNRRGFEAELARRLDAAAADRRRLTLVRLDLDDFHAYNERHGRTSGDRLLGEIAVLLRHCTRKSDVVARWADDEFAVLLVDDGRRRRADSEHPRSVDTLAERFERAIAEHAFERLGADAPGPVQVLAGLANFPWQAATRDDLLAAAAPAGEARLVGERIRLAGPRG